MKGAEAVPEKAIRHDTRAMSVAQVLLLFEEDGLDGLREMGTEQLCHLLRVVIAISLYCQKDERVHQMFC